MKCDELFSTHPANRDKYNVMMITITTQHFHLLIHDLHVLGVCPVAVVDRGEGDPPRPEEEGGEHHVRAVQRVDEVGRKPVPVLD